MKYLRGNTDYEYFLEGLRIPKKTYTADEIKRGFKLYVPVSDELLIKLSNNKVFYNMVGRGRISVVDDIPLSEIDTNEEKVEKLQYDLMDKDAQIASLRADLEKMKA